MGAAFGAFLARHHAGRHGGCRGDHWLDAGQLVRVEQRSLRLQLALGDQVFDGVANGCHLAVVPARHVRAVEDAASTSAPEIPVAYNLAPGESGLIPLELFSRAPAEGAISVAVLSGSAEQILTLEGSEFSLPALLYAGDMHMYTTNDGLMCRLVQRGTITTCTIDDLQRELQIAR